MFLNFRVILTTDLIVFALQGFPSLGKDVQKVVLVVATFRLLGEFCSNEGASRPALHGRSRLAHDARGGEGRTRWRQA
eukprot:scaffold213886_cov39-Prasinocladus_malaysianus.AAC.1